LVCQQTNLIKSVFAQTVPLENSVSLKIKKLVLKKGALGQYLISAHFAVHLLSSNFSLFYSSFSPFHFRIEPTKGVLSTMDLLLTYLTMHRF